MHELMAHEGELQHDSTSPNHALATESGNTRGNSGQLGATPCERFKRPSDVEPVSITVANATLRSAAGSPLPGPPGDAGLPLSRGSLTEGFLDRLFWSLLTGISILPAFQGDTHTREGPNARFEWPCWRRFEWLVARRPVSRVEWWMVAPPSRQPRATGSPKEGEVSVTAALSVPVGSRKTPERRSPAESGPQEAASTGLHEGC